MRKLFIAIAGATFLMAFAPAHAAAETPAKPAYEAAASLSAAACSAECGSVQHMRAIGMKYATSHRRGRSMSMDACPPQARAGDAQGASIRFATQRRRAGTRYASASRRASDDGFTMWT